MALFSQIRLHDAYLCRVSLGIAIGLGVFLLQLLVFLAVFGGAVKGVANAFGVGAFVGGIIVWALVFWIPFGEMVALGFFLYGIYALVTGG
ncbi:MAG: hypothetical protein PHD19_13945 [Dechloromonas sp.]|nr:hypothetical protein [Dechloromonas sp.]